MHGPAPAFDPLGGGVAATQLEGEADGVEIAPNGEIGEPVEHPGQAGVKVDAGELEDGAIEAGQTLPAAQRPVGHT